MSSRLVAMILWAAAAASAVFWGYRVFVKPAAVPPQATVAAVGAPAVGGDLTRLFGAPAPVAPPPTEAAVPADARFKLLGVVAPVAGQRSGLALISVDGKAARAVGVGGVVDGDLAVVSVSHRRVELGPRGGGNTMALELPAVPEASRGTLDAAGAGVPPMPAPAMPAAPSAGLPPGVVAPPGVPPRPALRRVVPPAVAPNMPNAPPSVPNLPNAPNADATAVPPPSLPFGVTPQQVPPAPRPSGMSTS